MVRKKLLLVVPIALCALMLSPLSPAYADPKCNELQLKQGTCVSGNINGGGVDLSGHKDAPGSGSGKSGGNGKGKPAVPVCQGLPAACQKIIVIPPGAPGNPGLTINDLKNFPAVPGTDHMEPNGWMVVGLDTNFYSVVGVEIVNGTLLGQPASVRFTPIAWHWTYGDGTGATRATPGGTWTAQGIPEFDPTATSHVYTAEGTYFIDLSITFSAEYKYATGNWTRVFGTITLPANRLKATAGDAKTVLVNRDCTQNPSGPGC
ncbi:MAG: hypothetical protein QOD50_1145 [Actinomycetota bacterium]|nr:hypothetical protein [Actinomycetota bacterium]